MALAVAPLEGQGEFAPSEGLLLVVDLDAEELWFGAFAKVAPSEDVQVAPSEDAQQVEVDSVVARLPWEVPLLLLERD